MRWEYCRMRCKREHCPNTIFVKPNLVNCFKLGTDTLLPVWIKWYIYAFEIGKKMALLPPSLGCLSETIPLLLSHGFTGFHHPQLNSCVQRLSRKHRGTLHNTSLHSNDNNCTELYSTAQHCTMQLYCAVLQHDAFIMVLCQGLSQPNWSGARVCFG